VFLARISKGRTIREYVLGAMMIPAVMCFVWFALVGGTAIDLELTGVADGAIAGAGQSDQLFAMLSVMLSDGLAYIMSVVVVILLLTYLVTSADSAVLIINTINAAGDEGPKARPHILFWGAALAFRGRWPDHCRRLGRDPDRHGHRRPAVQPCHGADGLVADPSDL
jgi:choline/glycine/proline betaine transport protein